MTPTWISQKVPPMGAIKAEGIKNQLGRPDLDRLTVFVREAAQNSWDAAERPHDMSVRFALALTTLDADGAAAWRSILEPGAPTRGHLPLREALEGDPLRVLFVSDRGTKGLGGPTRANVSATDGHDYASFILNVGDKRDIELGGGTYGFGKAVFYTAASASSILVHTRCKAVGGGIEARLVGAALGAAYEDAGQLHTGRHWFGLAAGDDVLEPVIGADADAIASRLGFPPFDGDELGTTIAVIAPRLDERDPIEAGQWMANAILWHFWPKMLVGDGETPAMVFEVSVDGKQIEIPPPASHSVLREFVCCVTNLDGADELRYGNSQTPIGRLRLRTTFEPPPIVDPVGQEAGLDVGVHHCCLLRAPDLVVEYRAGPRLPDENLWYAGVFRVHDDQDKIFAAAEPPTHDAWIPKNLEGRDRSVVRTTLEKLDKALKDHTAPRVVEGGAEDLSAGLAGISRFLGSLLAPIPGQAAGPGGQGGGGARRPSRVSMAGRPRWTEVDGRDVLVQDFDVSGAGSITVEAQVGVRVWGGTEADPPLGAARPALIGWRAPDGTIHPPGAGRFAVQAGEAGRWAVLVDSPPDTVARIRVKQAT